MSDIIRFEDGSAAAPSCAFTGVSWDTGIFLAAVDTLGFATAGQERMRIGSSGTTTFTGITAGSALLAGQSDQTDAADQAFGAICRHYTLSEESCMAFLAASVSAGNTMNIGGGSGSFNAMTAISFYTAATPTTLTGTERARVTAGGDFRVVNKIIVGTTIGTAATRTLDVRGEIRLDVTTQTTVGAAGGASVLPAFPTGYAVVDIGGTQYVVPYYAKS